jgi:hypothetical protein
MGKRKPLTKNEKAFAKALANGTGAIKAARLFLRYKGGKKWVCAHGSSEAQKAKDLARSPRIQDEVSRLQTTDLNEAEVEMQVDQTPEMEMEDLRKFAYDRLRIIAQDAGTDPSARWNAIQALEKLNDPGKDINLIYRYIDVLWRYYEGHCPACHTDFPLWKIKNQRLENFRQDHDLPPSSPIEDKLERRLALLREADPVRQPHAGQIKALMAEERHLVGTGAARAGKSFLLGMFLFMYGLIPGVENWLLARVYENADKELLYYTQFLQTIFYPVAKHMVDIQIAAGGDSSIKTRWSNITETRSGKAKGSITGHELEIIVVAEPAWVEQSLFEEVRARMSSRMGRIIAFGTPKGFGGFLGRLKKLSSRGPDGHIRSADDRLIRNGCPWNQSLAQFNMEPDDNPQYVISEKEAAKGELTREEYESEFEGKMSSQEGARFPLVQDRHVQILTKDVYERCVFVLGVDQGPKNFGSCLIGWDGKRMYVTWEFFDDTEKTIKANMLEINKSIPGIVAQKGGSPENWKLTIFDADPDVHGTLLEMVEEHRPWKTDETYRPKNLKDYTNWRVDTMEWLNDQAGRGQLIFDKDCDLLHDQLKDALIKPPDTTKERQGGNDKGWIVKDPWRGDHVMDAFLLACFCIKEGQLTLPMTGVNPTAPFEAERMRQDYDRIRQEKQELTGKSGDAEAWRLVYGQDRPESTRYYSPLSFHIDNSDEG